MKYVLRCAVIVISILVSLCFIAAPMAYSHTEMMDGPVAKDAKLALEKNDIMPIFKWLNKETEVEGCEAFTKAMTLRTKGPELKELADKWFVETVIRLHRQGAGAPTALKASGAKMSPAAKAADAAIESGSLDALNKVLSDAAAAALKDRLAKVQEKKKKMDESIDTGREYVDAYIDYIHCAEDIYTAATTKEKHRQ